MFMNPAAVPRASGRTTSNNDAKIFASYMPLNKPHAVSASTNTRTECVNPHSATNGAPHNRPNACTRMRPRGVRERRKSAIQPPESEPTMLAS